MNRYRVEFFRTTSGKSPVGDFIENLDGKTYVKLERLLELLAVYGPDIGMPYSKPLGQGLFELRLRGVHESRFLYVFISGQRIVILHAFAKRTQKTPKQELALARLRQRMYVKG
jgi:phage-related protein